MPYISQLLNNQVYDSADTVVGRLEDILISQRDGNFAPLEFLAVKTVADKKIAYVPYSYVENFTSSDISLKNLFANIPAQRNLEEKQYTRLKKDVLDRQIVDISGTRVVRVNDLRIGNFENKMSVLGIDASFRGLLRRLGLENVLSRAAFQVGLIDWRQAQLISSGPLQVNAMAENLGNLHPADLANIVEELDVQHGSNILTALDERRAAKVLEELDPNWQKVLVKYLGPDKAGEIVSQMSSGEIADLMKTFSEEEAQKFLAKVGGGKAEKVASLIEYGDNTAGGLMTTEYVSARPDWTVEQAVDEVKKSTHTFRSVVHVYITNADGKFYGVTSLRRLLGANPKDTMKKISKNLSMSSVLRPHDKLEKIIKIMTKYNLYTVAVLDKEKKMVGMVTIDNVMRQLFPSA